MKLFLCVFVLITFSSSSALADDKQVSVPEAVKVEILKVIKSVAPTAPDLKEILAAQPGGGRWQPEKDTLYFPAKMPENNNEWADFVFLAGHEAGHMFIFQVGDDLFLGPLAEQMICDLLGVQYLFTHRPDLVAWLRTTDLFDRIQIAGEWTAAHPMALRARFVQQVVDGLLIKNNPKRCKQDVDRALAEFLPQVVHGRDTSPIIIRVNKILDLCR